MCLLAVGLNATAAETTVTIKGLTGTLQNNTTVTFGESTLSYNNKTYLKNINAGEVLNLVPDRGTNTSTAPGYNKEGSLRLYPNNKLTFVCNQGYKISKIVFTLANTSVFDAPSKFSVGSGSKSTDGNTYTWSNTESVSEFTMTASTTNKKQFCFTSLDITYEIEGGGVTPNLVFSPVELTVGDSEICPKSANYPDLVYSYTVSEGTDIITIENGSIVAKKIGNAKVDVTTEAKDDYLAGSGSFNVTVVGKTPKMHFDNQVIYGKVNTGVVWQQVVVEEPTANAGAVTYSSSDPEVIEVDATTGRILPSGVKKSGVATITATMAAEGDYTGCEAYYQIMVIDPEEKATGNTIFDFTVENPYGMTTQSGSNAKYEGELENGVEEIAGENGIVKMSFAGRYRSWKTTTPSYELRVETKNQSNEASVITISVPEGYKITKIGITGSQVKPSYTPASAEITADPDFKSVWEPVGTDAVNNVAITASTEQFRISKINVLWDAVDSSLEAAHLTFTPNVNGIIVGEKWTINAVNNPNNREITYSIPALDEADVDYSITPIDDGKKLEVLVSQPGSYTLQATSPLGGGFRDGFAIMRLNVFRHINVYHEDALVEQENIKADATKPTYVKFDVPENAFVYYKLEAAADANVAAQADETEDENLEPGFTQYEDGVEIPANHNGALHFYIANYGYKSPVRKLSVGVATGVSEVEAAVEGEVKYYDLSGREVKGQPEQGIYIRLQGGKAEKVLVK